MKTNELFMKRERRRRVVGRVMGGWVSHPRRRRITRRTFNLISLKAQKQNVWHASRTAAGSGRTRVIVLLRRINSSKSRKALKAANGIEFETAKTVIKMSLMAFGQATS